MIKLGIELPPEERKKVNDLDKQKVEYAKNMEKIASQHQEEVKKKKESKNEKIRR